AGAGGGDQGRASRRRLPQRETDGGRGLGARAGTGGGPAARKRGCGLYSRTPASPSGWYRNLDDRRGRARPACVAAGRRPHPVRGVAAGDAFMRLSGRFGAYGGVYVPEILVPALEQLEAAFLDAQQDPAFHVELEELLTKYAGRPTPLTRCRNLSAGKARIYLKREDLLHGGAHKTNQVLAQALLAKRMGKTRLIAETGAGQH